MNCVHCGYLLFNLTRTRCPECGTPFQVTDYGFPPGQVHFLCPHCGQGYLGTDGFGLPGPRSFRCVKCNEPVMASEMIVRPLRDDVVGDCLRYGSVWDHREKIGLLRAYVQSTAQLLTRPADFFRKAFLNDRGEAVLYSTLSAGAGAVLLYVMIQVLNALGLGFVIAFTSISRAVATAVICWGALLVWNALFGVVAGLALRVMGARFADLDACFQIASYASAALPALVFPPAAVVWYVFIVAVGLSRTHEMSQARALVAAMMPLLVIGNLVVLVTIL